MDRVHKEYDRTRSFWGRRETDGVRAYRSALKFLPTLRAALQVIG
jgi:hypothetical protein